MAADLSTLRVGSRVKLRGPTKAEGIPRKPYPLGWRTVRDHDGQWPDGRPVTPEIFRVDGDDRWLPVSLIMEIKNGG